MPSRIKREARFLAIATAIAFVPVVWVAGNLWNPHGPYKTLIGGIVGFLVIVPGGFVWALLGAVIGNVWAALPAIAVEFLWLFLLSILLRLLFIRAASVAHRLFGKRRGDDCD
jgi:hypothetical protein